MSGAWSGVGQWAYFIVCSMRGRAMSRMSVAYTLLDLPLLLPRIVTDCGITADYYCNLYLEVCVLA